MQLLLGVVCCCCMITALAQKMDLVQLAESLGATTLVKYLQQSGLDTAISSSGPFTVFGPTNAAFDALPADVKVALDKDPDLLTKVLQYHATDGITYSNKLYSDMLVPSLAPGIDARVNVYYKRVPGTKDVSKTVTVNGAKVIVPDQNASNGVIHVIDKVLFPLPTGNIPQTVGGRSDLSTLLYAVGQANLTDTLNGDGPFTLFAPSNAAFDKIPSEKLTEILANQTTLEHILKYHIVPGTYYQKGLPPGFVRTMYLSYLKISEGIDALYVNRAKVINSDIPTTNGVIHIIDKVLIPRIC